MRLIKENAKMIDAKIKAVRQVKYEYEELMWCADALLNPNMCYSELAPNIIKKRKKNKKIFDECLYLLLNYGKDSIKYNIKTLK
jgi:hypothetical protein